MDERSGTIRLVDSRDREANGLVTTISRTEVEKALHEGPVDLLLDVERIAAEGDGRESERIALAWEPEDLERLLSTSSADQITLTFDEAEIRRLLDEDVDAHGMREKFAVLTVVAGMAAAGAGTAAAMYPASEGGGPSAGTPAAAVAPASEISTGLGTAPAAADRATASEVSSGLGNQSAPAQANLASASASEISTGIAGETPAAPAEISTGVVQEPPATPAEVTAGIVQHPTSAPISASPGDTTWAPSPAALGGIAGTILALSAAGFALRGQRRRPALP
jgi:hypothetical protein